MTPRSQLFRRFAGLVALLLLCLAAAIPARAEVTAYLYWQEGCPYCTRAKTALAELAETEGDLRVVPIELGASLEAEQSFRAAIAAYGIAQPAVPLLLIGDRHALGFASGGRSLALYRDMIEACRAGPCELRIAAWGEPAPPPAQSVPGPPQPPGQPASEIGDSVTLPWIGELRLSQLSLSVLTVVLAAIDGFNPCAMWVLALLIGLLLGVENTRRMWTLGAVFLLATGVMYFAVMAAWLNVVLWIGAVGWLRIAIGVLAIVAGGYYLREYWTNPEGVCKFTPSDRRRTITERFQALVETPNLVMASLGIAALAISVNLVELVCSAGIPAIYTQTLAMHDLSPGAYYGYILLYLAVFLFDDALLFVIAMVTLRAAVATGRFSRLSHLIGGVVLLALGAVMVLRPDLLA